MNFPVLPLAMAAVVVTVLLGAHAWALTASWVLVGIIAGLADRRYLQAERRERALLQYMQEQEPDRGPPVELTARVLDGPDRA